MGGSLEEVKEAFWQDSVQKLEEYESYKVAKSNSFKCGGYISGEE